MSGPLLELRAIEKTYPGVRALKGVSLAVHPGEVVGLIGENGAGKSTLMKVLGGVVAPSAGTVVIGGAEHASLTVGQSLGAGIAFVHQELNLFENLDVAANVFIGREPNRGGILRLVDRAGHCTPEGQAAAQTPRLSSSAADDMPVSRTCRSPDAADGRDRQSSLARRARSSSWTSPPPA